MTTPESPVDAVDPNYAQMEKTRLRTDLMEIVAKMGGTLDADAVTRIKQSIGGGNITTKHDLSKAISDEVSDSTGNFSGRDRKKESAMAMEALEDMDYPTEGEGIGLGTDVTLAQKIWDGPVSWLGDFVSGGTYGNYEDADKRKQNRKQKEAFFRQLLADKEITEREYGEILRLGILDDDRSLADAIDMMSEDFGVNDDVITETLRSTTTAVFRREEIERETAEQIEAFAEEEDVLTSDEDKLANRKAFETLSETYPGKYIWNSQNSMVYEAGTGNLVNKQGEAIWETGEEGDFNQEDLYWEEATKTQPPWIESNIDEDTYYNLIDVVNNPDRYHSGGMERFASGQQFLGGFASDYGVTQDQDVRDEQEQQEMQLQQNIAKYDTGYGRYNDFEKPDQQAVRRPWYDPMDNWALFAGKSPESVTQDQQWLIEMGAVSADDIVEGQWSSTEADAMNKMMFEANGRAEKIEDMDIDYWQEFWDDEGGSSSGASRRKFSAPAYRTLDPARIQLTIEDTVRRSLGRDASSDELADLGSYLSDQHRQSFAADVQAMEAEYDADTRAIDGERSAAGEVADVDYEARYQQAFNEKHEVELDRYSRTQNVAERQQLIGGALNNFMSQLGGGIGGGN